MLLMMMSIKMTLSNQSLYLQHIQMSRRSH